MINWPLRILAIVLSIAAVGWTWFELNSQDLASKTAVQDLAECKKLASEIESLRTQSNLVLAIAEPNHDFTDDIFSAFKNCQIVPESSLAAVTIGKVGETGLIKKSINEPIRGQVSIRQLVQFLSQLDSFPVTYFTDSIKLTPPTRSSKSSDRRQRDKEEWEVSFGIFYFESSSEQ